MYRQEDKKLYTAHVRRKARKEKGGGFDAANNMLRILNVKDRRIESVIVANLQDLAKEHRDEDAQG